MGLDRTRWPELMLGLDDVRILEVARDQDDRLHVVIETTDDFAGCGACGSRVRVKDRPLVGLADLPAFGSAVTLVWRKRRWFCPEKACPVGSFTEDRPDIAPARAVMTTRAGLWATREVGAEIHTVSYAARQIGVCWHTVMDAVTYWAQALIEDPGRITDTAAVGVDETKMNAGRGFDPTTWISAICDLDRRTVLDVIPDRQGLELAKWLEQQPESWRDGVVSTVTDLHEPFRRALRDGLPNATAIADPFHVVRAGNRAMDKTRRAVQNATLGHRGRKADPLYRARKLLLMAAERADENATARLEELLGLGDPDRTVYEAWVLKEAVRDLYTLWDEPELAESWFDTIIDGCRNATGRFARGLARTLNQWREPILAWHRHGHTNGPVEGLNSLIKKVKRVAAGFTNFDNYRTRILLAVGGCDWDLLGTPPR